MANKRKPHAVVSFNHPIKVEVRKPEFELLDSIRHLNIEALSKAARAEVEICRVKTCCGGQLVRAVVRKGMVTSLTVEPPPEKDRIRISPEFSRLLKQIHRRLERQGNTLKFPMPIRDFVAQVTARQGGETGIWVVTCLRICILGFCITCCWRSDGPLIFMCGHVTIDGTVWD